MSETKYSLRGKNGGTIPLGTDCEKGLFHTWERIKKESVHICFSLYQLGTKMVDGGVENKGQVHP